MFVAASLKCAEVLSASGDLSALRGCRHKICSGVLEAQRSSAQIHFAGAAVLNRALCSHSAVEHSSYEGCSNDHHGQRYQIPNCVRATFCFKWRRSKINYSAWNEGSGASKSGWTFALVSGRYCYGGLVWGTCALAADWLLRDCLMFGKSKHPAGSGRPFSSTGLSICIGLLSGPGSHLSS